MVKVTQKVVTLEHKPSGPQACFPSTMAPNPSRPSGKRFQEEFPHLNLPSP